MLAQLAGNIFDSKVQQAAYGGLPYWLYVGFLCLYIGVLLLLAIYGLHRYILVYLYYKYRKNVPQPAGQFDSLPTVCIQLPMYNEQYVAQRIIEYTCQMDYPRDKLEIQVLDDSTDQTVQIATQAVQQMREQGLNIKYIHRDNRAGYKAGALESGLTQTDAEFVAIFDADFLPKPDMLKRTIQYFTDPLVGMVQVRWDHLNRNHSLLTKTQAILLDGHFVIEHGARSRSGRFMSFNGTAGIWRRSCIFDAGGWQHDTLTEDLDLSYRAQLKGWKFLFLPEVIAPAELPPEMTAFKQQQHRWTKGGAQTCKKLLPMILRSKINWKIKLEAFFHLTSCTVYLYIVSLTVMLFPALYVRLKVFPPGSLGAILFGFSLFLLASCSASTFYLCSQREIFNHWRDKIKYLPFLMAVGIGISLNNARACLEGFFGGPSEFVRTPKFGITTAKDDNWKKRVNTFKRQKSYQPFLELFFALYMMACICLCLFLKVAPMTLPFLVLFAVGYFYVSLNSLFVAKPKTWQSLAKQDAQLVLEGLNTSQISGQATPSQFSPQATDQTLDPAVSSDVQPPKPSDQRQVLLGKGQ